MKITVHIKVEPERAVEPQEEAEMTFSTELHIPDATVCLRRAVEVVKPALRNMAEGYNHELEHAKKMRMANARTKGDSPSSSAE